MSYFDIMLLYNRSMKNIFVVILLFLTFFLMSGKCYSKHLYKEAVYQNYWCAKRGGISEYKLNDFSRVDCLLPDMAVEFDFARKRDECLGQAQRYAAYTHRQPACVLIIERKKDLKYLNQLRYTIKKQDLPVKIFTITPSTLVKAGILSDELQ